MSTNLKVNQRVRVCTMNGCMAHIRHNPTEGKVVKITEVKLYGDNFNTYPYAAVEFDDGSKLNLPAGPNHWIEYEGLMEYRR